jgi:hypothetical protein
MEKTPCALVVVPWLVPLMVTDTLGTGLLSVASVTVPDITLSCAVASMPRKRKPTASSSLMKFLITVFLGLKLWLKNKKHVA